MRWNLTIEARFDYLTAVVAGLEKTEAAVKVSKLFGNKSTGEKHKKYDGPSAAVLYKRGYHHLRDMKDMPRGVGGQSKS